MKIGTSRLRRYRQIAVLLWMYGRSDLVKQMNVGEEMDDEGVQRQQPGEAHPVR